MAHSNIFQLKPNAQWTPGENWPEVSAQITTDHEFICVTFEVREKPEYFRCECRQDGDPCWQDSCVEVFLKADVGYYNFELNSAGFCLAEHGLSRAPRRTFQNHEYQRIMRQILCAPTPLPDGRLHWKLEVKIPHKWLNLPPNTPIWGNLYKCASYAQIPNYLSAFPIDTPAPDFHRPEFFKQLLP